MIKSKLCMGHRCSFKHLQLFKSDQQGAVMLPGIFMAMFLVAMMYMVAGIGRTLLETEGMQDAADASAYSAAIIHARGMNLIVFINLLMAALVAILIVLRLTQTLLVIASVALFLTAWFTGGAGAVLGAQASNAAVQVENIYSRTKKAIFPILKGLHKTQEAVSVVIPWVAMGDGMAEAAIYHPPASGAIALPGSKSLPIEPDKFPVLCEHASEIVADLAMVGFSFLLPGVPDSVFGVVSDAAGEAGKATSKFLCGDGKGAPPSYAKKFKEQMPRANGMKECEKKPNSSQCKLAERELDRARPRRTSGVCRKNCTFKEPYERMARRARHVCEPTPGRILLSFTWQESRVRGEFVFDGKKWNEESRQILSQRLRPELTGPPCGAFGLGDEWNLDSGSRSLESPLALCSEPIPFLAKKSALGARRSHSYREVTRIFSCVQEVTRDFKLGSKSDALGGKKSSPRSPFKMEKNVHLGNDVFQIRALAFGSKPGAGEALEFVKLADHQGRHKGSRMGANSNIEGRFVGLANQIGRFSVAQAEYYFQGTMPRSEWMWNMNWVARLKRFRLPSVEEIKKEKVRRKKSSSRTRTKISKFKVKKQPRTAAEACKKRGQKKCSGMKEKLRLLDGLVIH